MGTLLLDEAVQVALFFVVFWLLARPAFMRRRLVMALRALADAIERDRWGSISYRGRVLIGKTEGSR